MSKSTPSLLALLGLVAVAGYQNRGRISEMLSDAKAKSPETALDARETGETRGGGGFMSEIGNLFGGATSAGTLSAGLGDLVNRFRDSGRAAQADSWISTKANMPVNVRDLEEALGDETLDELAGKTGLTRAELLLRLNSALPEVVNRFTPDGHLPTESEAHKFD